MALFSPTTTLTSIRSSLVSAYTQTSSAIADRAASLKSNKTNIRLMVPSLDRINHVVNTIKIKTSNFKPKDIAACKPRKAWIVPLIAFAATGLAASFARRYFNQLGLDVIHSNHPSHTSKEPTRGTNLSPTVPSSTSIPTSIPNLIICPTNDSLEDIAIQDKRNLTQLYDFIKLACAFVIGVCIVKRICRRRCRLSDGDAKPDPNEFRNQQLILTKTNTALPPINKELISELLENPQNPAVTTADKWFGTEPISVFQEVGQTSISIDLRMMVLNVLHSAVHQPDQSHATRKTIQWLETCLPNLMHAKKPELLNAIRLAGLILSSKGGSKEEPVIKLVESHTPIATAVVVGKAEAERNDNAYELPSEESDDDVNSSGWIVFPSDDEENHPPIATLM